MSVLRRSETARSYIYDLFACVFMVTGAFFDRP